MTDQLTLSLSFQWFWPMLTFVNHGSRGWWYCFLSLPVLCSPAHGTSHSLCMSTLLSGQILSTLFRIITDSSRSLFDSVQFSSATQSCPTLCNPMNRSTPGLPVHHREFTQTHVHRVGDAIQPSHPLSSPSPPAPNPSQHQSLFQWVNSSHGVAKVLEFQL